jgi:phospholipase A-2-activating protein
VSAACVWDVAWLPCGDLVTACADYTARVFTAKPDLAASAEAVAGFAAAVEARKQPQQAQGQDASMGGQLPAGLKMEEASVLLQPGKKDGDTRIVKEGGAGVAYSWNASRSFHCRLCLLSRQHVCA